MTKALGNFLIADRQKNSPRYQLNIFCSIRNGLFRFILGKIKLTIAKVPGLPVFEADFRAQIRHKLGGARVCISGQKEPQKHVLQACLTRDIFHSIEN